VRGAIGIRRGSSAIIDLIDCWFFWVMRGFGREILGMGVGGGMSKSGCVSVRFLRFGRLLWLESDNERG
jgi:hypothetical protein